MNRAFFGVPDLTNSEGLHTNAVYGFLNILFKILDEEKPQYLAVAFDRSEPTFRHQMYEAYKGTRKPMAEELRQQVPVMKEVLAAMGVVTVEQPGLEADDILGTLSVRAEGAGMEVSIISGDRDLLQLATEKVKIRIPKTKRTGTEIEDYYAADVLERYQVTPKEFIDVKALMGDSSDNIPGVPGIGEKGATNIIAAYRSIENAYAHLEEIKPKRAQNALAEHYDLAQMSKTLAAIETHADLSFDMEAARMGELYTPEAYLWFKKLEFKQMLTRFEHADAGEGSVEENFCILTDREEAEQLLEDLAAEEKACAAEEEMRLAVALLEEAGQVYGAAVAWRPGSQPAGDGGKDPAGKKTAGIRAAFFPCGETMSAEELAAGLQRLCGGCGRVIAPDIKALLKHVELAEGKVMDVNLAAYLLNPLKNEYSYDDIARDYLGEMIPARTGIF